MLANVFLPNLHVLMIHYPIALATLGLGIELFSVFWRQSSFRVAGRWMILLGTLLSLPGLSSGLYAAWQAQGGAPGMNWHEIKSQANFDENRWELLRDHIVITAIGVGIMLVVVIAWLASSDLWRKRLYAVHLLAMLLGVAGLCFGAHHGGELRYQGLGTIHNPPDAKVSEIDDQPQTLTEKVDAAVPIMEIHLLLAGLTVAMSLAAVGLSLRRVGQTRQSEQSLDSDIAAALIAQSEGRSESAMLQPSSEMPSPTVPAARFWFLSSALAIVTAATGWWTFGNFDYNAMLDYARHPEHRRVLFHCIFGLSLVALPLLLAIFTRFAPRARVILWILVLAILLVIAAQVWMGILLLFDTNTGPLQGFTSAE